MKRFTIILIFLLPIFFAQAAFAQKPFKLRFVHNFNEDGDALWLANTKKKDRIDGKAVARLGTIGNSPSGKININGHDIELRFIKEFSPDRNYKVGRGGYQIWKGKDITVRLDYIWTWLCPPKDENCEVYYYKGVLNIRYKGTRRKVSVVGEGGS